MRTSGAYWRRNCASKGINWRRHYTRNIPHDLQVIDFRLAVERAVGELPALELGDLDPGADAARAASTACLQRLKARNGELTEERTRRHPRWRLYHHGRAKTTAGRAACWNWIWPATATAVSSMTKFCPMPPISPAPCTVSSYGANSGRWLVVVARGERRLENLLQQMGRSPAMMRRSSSSQPLDWLQGVNVLTAPIWEQPGRSEPVALVQTVEPYTITVAGTASTRASPPACHP